MTQSKPVWLLPPEQRTNAMLIDVIDTVSQKKCYDWLIFYSIGSLEAAADECRMNILYYTFDMIQSLCVFIVWIPFFFFFFLSKLFNIKKLLCGIWISHCRLLWRRFECHNCVCCVLYAGEQSAKLQIHHGEFIQVSFYLKFSFITHFRELCLMGYSCFRYVIGTLELLVAENYMIVYLNGATSRKKMPTVGWLRKCYQQIDRRWASCTTWNTGF